MALLLFIFKISSMILVHRLAFDELILRAIH